MRRVWMVFAAVMICWGVQAQEGFDAKMRRAGLVDVLAVDSTLRVKLMYSAPDNFMRRDVYGDLETAYLLPHFARKVAAAQRLLRASASDCLRAFLRRFPALRRQAFSRPTSGTTTPTGRFARATTCSTPLCPLSSICKKRVRLRDSFHLAGGHFFEAQCSSQSRLLPTALCQPRRSFSFFAASICGSNVTSQCQRL